jgi:hypothetical protein
MKVSQLVAPLVSSLADGVVERDLHGEVDIIHAQIKATSRTISSLSASLGDTVEASLSNRLPAHVGVLPDSDKFMPKDDILAFVEDNKALVLAARQDAIQVSGDTCKGAITALLDKLPALLEKGKAQCDARISKLEGQLGHLSASLGAKFGDSKSGLQSSLDVKPSSPVKVVLADSVPSSLPVASAEAPAQLLVGDKVRLCGLKVSAFNNMIGMITCHSESSGRFGVRLHGEGADKAFLPKNLSFYQFSDTDRCPICNDYVNLNSFPQCSCSEHRTTKV